MNSNNVSVNKVQVSTFGRLVGLTLKHAWVLVQGGVMMVLGVVTSLIEPRIYGLVIDDAIIPKRLNWLWFLGVSYLGLTCLRIYTTRQQNFLFEVLSQRVTHDLRQTLFSHMQRLPISVFDRNSSGSLMTRMTNDISALAQMFSSGFVLMFTNAALVVGIIVWLLVLDLKLGLIAISVFPVMVVISIYFSRQLQEAYQGTRSRMSELNGFLAENLNGVKVLQLFNRQTSTIKKFDRLNQNYSDAQVNTIQLYAYFQPLITIGAGISIALVIGFGGYESHAGGLKLGVLVAFFSYVTSIFQPLRDLADKWNVFLSGMASAERVFAILDLEAELIEEQISMPSQAISGVRGHLVFENVWFAYSGDNWVIKNFSLEIQPGEKIGIVGRSGAGKTSIINLLLRFYEPTKGRILLDGVDIRELDRRSLRASIGVVHQDAVLFSATHEENVTFWGDSAKVSAVFDALQFKPSSVGGLSAGERQILGLARVLALNPKMWILDESTSNIDFDQESRVRSAIDLAAQGRTGIFIAHRMSTLKSVDRIFELRDGVLHQKAQAQDVDVSYTEASNFYG